MKQLNHPIVGEVALNPSLRARRITLTVRPSGEVRLTYPMGLAEARPLAFLEAKVAWIERARERLAKRPATVAPTLDPVAVEALRRAAKADLPHRMAHLSTVTGLRYSHLTITSARTKWGSCSGKNRIALSLFLMTLPEHLRDFVILHELAHTVHHNHSTAFYALLDQLCGGRERILRRELKGYRAG